MVNRYFNPSVYSGALYTPPVEAIASGLETMQKQYDQNFAQAEQLRNQFIKARTSDRPRANELQNEINGRIDNIVSKYSGDYSQASKDLYSLRRDIAKTFGPGGEAHAIQSNLALQEQSLQEERDRLKKGEITASQFNYLKNFYEQSPPTTKDVNTGEYSSLGTLALAKYSDVGKIFDETYKNTKPRSISWDEYAGKAPGGHIRYVTKSKQGIDPQELLNSFKGRLLNDREFVEYVSQTAAFENRNPDEVVKSILEEYKTNVVPLKSGVFDLKQESKLYDDFGYRESVKFNNAKKLAQFRHNLTKEEQENQTSGAEDILVPIKGTGTSFKKIEPKTVWRPMPGMFSAVPTTIKPDVNQILKNGDSKEYNIPLLQSLKEANPKVSNVELTNLYNDALSSNINNYNVTYKKYNTTSSQKEAFDLLAPSLSTGRSDMYRVSASSGKVERVDSFSDKKDLAAAWLNAKTPSAYKRSLGISRTNNGAVPLGQVLPSPDGSGDYYIVKETKGNFAQMQSEVLDKAFSFIQNDLRRQSEPFAIGVNNKTLPVIGRKEYLNGSERIVYYSAEIGSDGQYHPKLDDPLHYNGRTLNPSDIEDLLIPQADLNTLYPRKTAAAFKNEVEIED